MASYKLIYFDMRGRAEPMRILFALADVEYEDVRISFQEFAEMKSTLPYGQVPILEVGDTRLSQSAAIGRYLSRKFGFHGKTDMEAAKIDEFTDAISEYSEGFGAIRKAKDDDERAEATKKFVEVMTPKYFAKWSALLEANGGKFMVGDSLTWADIVLYNIVDFFEAATGFQLSKDFPVIQNHVKGVAAVPKIRDWIERRPKTKM